MSQTPSDLKYTREHEWIRLDGNQAEIGITFHAQKSLGDIVYVELPSVGDELEAGEEFGSERNCTHGFGVDQFAIVCRSPGPVNGRMSSHVSQHHFPGKLFPETRIKRR